MATTTLKDLKPNAENPRKITDTKLAMLKKSLLEFGDLSGIVFNRKTKQIVGGHQRQEALDAASIVKIEKKYAKPTRTGTVAEGYVVVKNERFSYREVNWSDSKEKAANIAANKGAGEWDLTQLSKWMRELDGNLFDLDLTMFDEVERVGFLADIEKINHGSENDEWAKMGSEEEFKEGEKYILLSFHFKTEDAREKYVEKNKIKISDKYAGAWIVKL